MNFLPIRSINHQNLSSYAYFTPSIQTQHAGPFIAKLNKGGDYEFVNSYYTGFDDDEEWGAGHVACSPDESLYFTTNIQDSISLGTPIYKQGLNSGVYLLKFGFANNRKAIQKLIVKKE